MFQLLARVHVQLQALILIHPLVRVKLAQAVSQDTSGGKGKEKRAKGRGEKGGRKRKL